MDYYYRATLLELERDQLMRPNGPNCVGDIPEVTYNFNFWLQMASTFKDSKTQPFFGYSFFNHLTHLGADGARAGDHLYLHFFQQLKEMNVINNTIVIFFSHHGPRVGKIRFFNHLTHLGADGARAGDHLYLHFFQQLKEMNVINNTIVIFFSDHGPRVGKIRWTYPGMVESMTPHVFLIFPPWFHRKYPDLGKVLKINQERLTTNRDLHATLLDILNFQGKPGIRDIKQPGISLFNEIPRHRTCDHAEIGVEFCVCNKFTQGHVSSSIKFSLAIAVQDKLGFYIQHSLDKCQTLTVRSVQSVLKIQLDNDGNKEDTSVYQITITTSPGDAIYEARLSVDDSSKMVNVLGDVTRLNIYRGQDACVDDPKLKPYCYCWGHKTMGASTQ